MNIIIHLQIYHAVYLKRIDSSKLKIVIFHIIRFETISIRPHIEHIFKQKTRFKHILNIFSSLVALACRAHKAQTQFL